MLLDALGYLGDSLDKPGRAVRGLLGGRPEELLAALPFSDSLGITDKANRVSGQDLTGLDDGSLLSTLGNMAAEVGTDPLMFAGAGLGRMLGGRAAEAAVARGPRYATTEDDLLRMARDLDQGGTINRINETDLAWHKLTTPKRDPFGEPIGPAAGGRQFNPKKLNGEARDNYNASLEGMGRSADEWAAIAEDPERLRHAMETERGVNAAVNRNMVEDSLVNSMGNPKEEAVKSLFENYAAQRNPADLTRLLSEIHPNSKMLGSGQEAIAFRAPSGEVIRIELGKTGRMYPGRPIAPGVLPTNSTLDVGTLGRVERVPFAENVNDFAHFRKRNPETMRTPVDDVDRALAESNLKLSDRHLGNLGMHNGSPVVIDPGAVRPPYVASPGYTTGDVSLFTGQHAPVTEARDPSRLMNALLNSIGSDDAVRRAYAQGLSGPAFGRKLGAYGAGVGADTGILARMLAGE